MKVTKDVIADLWPVYESGEATADTKALVEEFLAQDAAFAGRLRSRLELPGTEAQLSRETETQALRRTRDLLQGRGWIRGVRLMALVFTVFAVIRVFTGFGSSLNEPAGTTWTVSSRVFIGDTICAIVSWTVYAVALNRQRRKALRVSRQRPAASGR